MQSFKKVTEASYLTADKASTYRAILRYFYIQHKRMRESLFPEEIHAYLMEQNEFKNYTTEQLQLDLAQLVNWNNLRTHQETSKARTIEEFKKKRFRYQPTPYTIEFERMLTEMENGGEVFGGSLEKKEFERLYQALNQIVSILSKGTLPEKDECSQLWNDVFTYFQTIQQNTADYFAHINSKEAEEQMQTAEFLVFKDKFTHYLRDFIIGLQQTATKIKQVFTTINEQTLLPLVKQVVLHQQQVPRFQDLGLDEDELLTEQLEKWQNIAIWFLGNEHGESMLDSLENRTNEQIRRITRVVQRLGERHHYFRSRKKDYLHLAKWFDDMTDIDEAHELSAIAFGVFHTRHLFSDQIPTDDIYTDVWEEKPVVHTTKPRTVHYREKTKAGAIVNRKEKIANMRKEYLVQKQAERVALETYLHDGKIELEALPMIETHVRKILLGWIAKGMTKNDGILKTAYGQRVKVTVHHEKRVKLMAEDGVMEMPGVTFEFIS